MGGGAGGFSPTANHGRRRLPRTMTSTTRHAGHHHNHRRRQFSPSHRSRVPAKSPPQPNSPTQRPTHRPRYFRFGQESSAAYLCPYPAHCLGGANASEQCSSVSSGILCFECAEDHYYDLDEGHCEPCEAWKPSIEGLVICSLLLLAVLTAVGYFVRKKFLAWREKVGDAGMSREASSRLTQSARELAGGGFFCVGMSGKKLQNKLKIL